MISIDLKLVNIGTKKDPEYVNRTARLIRWAAAANREDEVRDTLESLAILRAIQRERDLTEAEEQNLEAAKKNRNALRIRVYGPASILALLEGSYRLPSGDSPLSNGERRELLSRLRAVPVLEDGESEESADSLAAEALIASIPEAVAA